MTTKNKSRLGVFVLVAWAVPVFFFSFQNCGGDLHSIQQATEAISGPRVLATPQPTPSQPGATPSPSPTASATPDRTQDFLRVLTDIDTMAFNYLSRLGMPQSVFAGITPLALQNPNLTQADVEASKNQVLQVIAQNAYKIAFIPASQRAQAKTALISAVNQLNAFDPATISPQARWLRSANLDVLNDLIARL